jgi:ABC-type spermidine/putrescine transport system permease subunit II
MDVAQAVAVFAITIAVLFACRGLMYARPTLRGNAVLRLALNLSLAVLAVEVAFGVLFAFAIVMWPDMSEF